MDKVTLLNNKYLKLFFVLLISGWELSVTAQIQNFGGLHINTGGNVSVTGSFVNSGASTDLSNSGNLHLTGDFTNNGNDLDASGTGTVIFQGTATQNINGTQASTFYNVSKPNTNDIIIANNETVNNALTLTAGTFNLNDHNLTLNGAFSGTGTLTGSATSGLIIGGSAGTLKFTQVGTGNFLDTLTLNASASATLSNALNIAAGSSTRPGTVTASTGSTLNASGNLTLKSDAGGTSRVAASTGTISGNVTVERYIPPRRAWRFLSVPFSSSAQTIRQAWQEGVNNLSLAANNNPNPGFGTHITGDNNNISLGYDFNTTKNPSLKVWQSSGWSSTEPATVSDNILKYPAYCLFVRGSRAVNLSQGVNAVPDPTVLRITGILNQVNGAAITKNYSSTAGDFFFIGNPYASSVDISVLLSNARAGTSGIDYNKFWIWNPRLNGSYGVGGYVAYSNGLQAPGNEDPGYTAGTVIQSGQAFMVQASSSTSSVRFQENDKNSLTQPNVFGRPLLEQTPAGIYANLMVPSADSLLLVDGVTAGFGESFSGAIDAYDAAKQWNIDENIALVRNTKRLAIEFRPDAALTDTLFFQLYLRKQPYVLKIFSHNTAEGLPEKAWLVDKYLDTMTAVNLAETSLHSFTANTDTNSYRNRFMLVFTRKPKEIPQVNIQPGSIDIYPNPVMAGSRAIFKFSNMPEGRYAITLNTIAGETLIHTTIEHAGTDNSYPLPLNAGWQAGTYPVKITSENGYSFTTKLVIGR